MRQENKAREESPNKLISEADFSFFFLINIKLIKGAVHLAIMTEGMAGNVSFLATKKKRPC